MRLSLSKDETEIARFDLADKSWKVLGGDEALALRKAIRIANGEAAPAMVYAPVVVNN